MKISIVENQIKETLILLKIRNDPFNPWFLRTIKFYEQASVNPTELNLKKLLGLSRAYLETLSDWSQDFFIETDKTEELIKEHLKIK